MPRNEEITVYKTDWCGYCIRLTRQLDEAGVAYRTVDVEIDLRAAEHVERINGGYRTVPTVEFPDGSTATNPPVGQVLDRLRVA